MTWRFDTTLSTTAGPLPVLDGSFTWDRGWTPLGAGTFTVPLEAWDALGLDPLTRHPMVVHHAFANYTTTGRLGDPLIGHPLLVDQEWPDVRLDAFSDETPQTATLGWHVLLRSVTVDRRQATARIEVQTFELALLETVNTSTPWMPAGKYGGGYDAADVLVQMFRYIGIHVPVEVVANSVIPPEEMVPWELGQDAWTYWDRVRTLGQLGANYDPASGIVTIEAANNFVGTIPAEVAEHVEEYGSANYDSATYADALTVRWRWTVQTVNGPEERERTDVAYAAGLANWRDARRHAVVDRIGPPVNGYAQRAVNNMARFRTVHRVTVPLTRLLLASAPGFGQQSCTFDFGPEPTATITLLTT